MNFHAFRKLGVMDADGTEVEGPRNRQGHPLDIPGTHSHTGPPRRKEAPSTLRGLTYSIKETRFCRLSRYTGWHLKRGVGAMTVTFTLPPELQEGQPLIRALLVRKNAAYRHFGVDQVCAIHAKELSGHQSRQHVLQAPQGMEGFCYFDVKGIHPSIVFPIKPIPAKPRDLSFAICLKNLCCDSCVTSRDPTFKPTEGSRDLLLILNLETKDGIIKAREIVKVWTKAEICPRDLRKRERRKAKGGARLLETGRNEGRIEPKVKENPGKIVKLLVPVPCKKDVPTARELMDAASTIAVSNARLAGLDNKALAELIRKGSYGE